MLHELHARNNNLGRFQPFEHTPSFTRCTHYSLQNLDLSENKIMGLLPNLTLFSPLKELWLSSNQFNGTVPKTIGQLAQLEVLNLFGNSLEDVISEAHFSKLEKLSSLVLADNLLVLKFSSHCGFLSWILFHFGPANWALSFQDGFKLKKTFLTYIFLTLEFQILFQIGFGLSLLDVGSWIFLTIKPMEKSQIIHLNS